MTTSLIVGRFQGFHNGHLEMIRFALSKGKLILCLGVAKLIDNKNPFSFMVRRSIIYSCLTAQEQKNITILPLYDIPESDAAWLKQLSNIVGAYKVDGLIGTAKDFSTSNYLKLMSDNLELPFINYESTINCHGTLVREAYYQNNLSFISNLIPKEAFKTLRKHSILFNKVSLEDKSRDFSQNMSLTNTRFFQK